MDKAFLLLVRDFSPRTDEIIQLLVTLFSPPNSKGKLITFESSNTYSYSMALFTLGEYTIKAVQQVGRQFKMLTQPIPSAAVRAFSVLLFFTLFLPSNEGYAQTQVAALRDYHQVTGNNYYNSRGFYFEDQHHDLDKFAGEWEGAGFGGYQWRTRIAVQKKANCHNSYWSDALGLELSIKKDGKAAITPTGNLIPGTSFIQGFGLRWEMKKQAVDPNIYKVLFSYGEADKPYQESVELRLYINATHDTIVIRRGYTIEIEHSANIPDYIPPGGYLAEVCTLRRVKK